MSPKTQLDYSTEDLEIQGILSKELKEQWLTKHSKFAPIKEFESPESPIEAMTSPRYSPISPALPRHSQHTPISNCSPISSNPSRHLQHTPISNCSPISSNPSRYSSDDLNDSDEDSNNESSDQFLVLGWSNFKRKNERKSGKYVVIKFKSSSFSARGQRPIKGFFMIYPANGQFTAE